MVYICYVYHYIPKKVCTIYMMSLLMLYKLRSTYFNLPYWNLKKYQNIILIIILYLTFI